MANSVQYNKESLPAAPMGVAHQAGVLIVVAHDNAAPVAAEACANGVHCVELTGDGTYAEEMIDVAHEAGVHSVRGAVVVGGNAAYCTEQGGELINETIVDVAYEGGAKAVEAGVLVGGNGAYCAEMGGELINETIVDVAYEGGAKACEGAALVGSNTVYCVEQTGNGEFAVEMIDVAHEAGAEAVEAGVLVGGNGAHCAEMGGELMNDTIVDVAYEGGAKACEGAALVGSNAAHCAESTGNGDFAVEMIDAGLKSASILALVGSTLVRKTCLIVRVM